MQISPINNFNVQNLDFKGTQTKKPEISNPVIRQDKTMEALDIQGKTNMQQVKRLSPKAEIEQAIKEADDLAKKVQDEAKNIEFMTDEAIYKMFKKHQELGYYTKSCEELSPNGEVLRKITMNDNGTTLLEEFNPKEGTSDITFFENGKPYFRLEGYAKNAEDEIKFSKYCLFENGEITLYQQGYEKKADGSMKCDISIEYKDGEAVYCQQGTQELPDGTEKCDKILVLGENNSYWYQENFNKSAKGTIRIGENISIENGQINWYEKNSQESEDSKSYKVEKGIDYIDGKPIRIEINTSKNRRSNRIYSACENGWKRTSK